MCVCMFVQDELENGWKDFGNPFFIYALCIMINTLSTLIIDRRLH